MDATKDLAIFGRNGASDVEITLPLTVKASKSVLHDFTVHVYVVRANLGPRIVDARAIIVVDFDGRSASSSWYEIWEAVNAIAYMCVRPQKKGGRASGIGKYNSGIMHGIASLTYEF